MLSAVRTFAKSWVAKVLLALVMLSFLFIGARSGLPSRISNDVVDAGSRRITADDFKRIFENYKQQAEQQNGQPISNQDAVTAGMDKRALQEISGTESVLEFVRRSGVRPDDQLVADALRQERDFFDPVTGRFDQKAYQAKLASVQLTPARYESLLRDQISQNHVAAGLAAGLRAPAIYGALIAEFELENRSFSFFYLDQRNIPPVAAPTDADIQAFVQKNAARLMQPELRNLTVIRFSAKALASSQPVDEAAVHKLYDFRKDTASTPEKRSLVEIATKDAASAASVAKRLKAGESAAGVAKSVGVQPISYSDTAQSAIADPQVASAAFALKAGDVSAPIQSSLAGYAVVMVQSVTPAKAADFESMRPALEAQVRADAAGKVIYGQVQKFEDTRSGGANLADAAKAAGVTPVSIGPISATGATATGQPIPEATPKLLKDAFSLSQDGESDVEDDGAGEYFIVHVDKITPPAPPSLQDPRIKQALTQVVAGQNMIAHLQASADALAQRLRKGETLEALATSVGSSVAHAPTVNRDAMAKNQSLSPDLIDKMFSAKAGDVITGRTAQGTVMVAHLDAITPAVPVLAAPMAAQQVHQVSDQLFQDLGQGLRAAAAAAVKPRVYPDRALAALDISPDQLTKTPGAAPKGPAQ